MAENVVKIGVAGLHRPHIVSGKPAGQVLGKAGVLHPPIHHGTDAVGGGEDPHAAVFEPPKQLRGAGLGVIGVCQLVQKPGSHLLGIAPEGIFFKQPPKPQDIQLLPGDLTPIQKFPKLAVDLPVGIAHLVAHCLPLRGIKLPDDPPLGGGCVQQAVVNIKENRGKFHGKPPFHWRRHMRY